MLVTQWSVLSSTYVTEMLVTQWLVHVSFISVAEMFATVVSTCVFHLCD